MQINPQVNTSIIRSVTLRHCPRGMCEFHLVCTQMDDNSSNQVPSERPPPHPKCMCACFEMWAQYSHGRKYVDYMSNLNDSVSSCWKITEVILHTTVKLSAYTIVLCTFLT